MDAKHETIITVNNIMTLSEDDLSELIMEKFGCNLSDIFYEVSSGGLFRGVTIRTEKVFYTEEEYLKSKESKK